MIVTSQKLVETIRSIMTPQRWTKSTCRSWSSTRSCSNSSGLSKLTTLRMTTCILTNQQPVCILKWALINKNILLTYPNYFQHFNISSFCINNVQLSSIYLIFKAMNFIKTFYSLIPLAISIYLAVKKCHFLI